MSLLSAETSVSLPDPLSIVNAFEDHFSEHMEMERDGSTVRFKTEYGHGSFSAEGSRFAARVNCVSEHILTSVKAMVAEHIAEFSGEAGLDFRWSGHGAEQRELPNLFRGKVARAYNLTPHMRRLVLSVESGIDRLLTGGMHVRLLLVPDQARAPVWPYLAPTGAIIWPEGDDLLTRRVYTIRSGDVGRGEVDIDFVMHEGDHMPGATFGATAKPGDVVGIVGPSGVCPEADRYVFAGDETALPVMLRMAAEMPAGKKLSVYAEIDDEAERQEVVCAAGRMDMALSSRQACRHLRPHRKGAARACVECRPRRSACLRSLRKIRGESGKILPDRRNRFPQGVPACRGLLDHGRCR